MKARYVPDLARQMAVCELNYTRLERLMPDLACCDRREFLLDGPKRQRLRVRIEVLERFAYTSTVQLSQMRDKHGCDWLDAPTLTVRLYHDAAMAEVVSSGHRQLSGTYAYPNQQMHQPDEKQQLNDYLGEWLNHCLKFSQTCVPAFD